MNDAEFLRMIIEVLRRILYRSAEENTELSLGRVLDISQALDEMIVAYYRL